jgi:ketosteroid isomerase-like protein
MRPGRPRAVLAVVAALAAAPAAQSPTAWQSLVNAERAFASHSVRETTREAFLSHLHPRSVMFSPGPVNGIELYAGSPSRPGQLAWAPEVVDIAASGDFGYSTGPHQFRRTPEADVVRQGYFCSVWVRTTTEPWKVLIDLGSTQPQPLSLDVVARDPTPEPAVSAGPTALRALEAAERRLADALPGDQIAAYRAALATHARVNRDGGPPAEGTQAALARIGQRGAVRRATPEKVDVAASGDLGYAYGRLDLQDAAADAPPVYYVRVWRHDAQGWRVVLDVDTWRASR